MKRFAAAIFLAGVAGASACTPGQVPDPRLLEAIDLYTGVAGHGVDGHVDDERAHDLLTEVADETWSPLSRMWLARVHARGRMGFDKDEAKARRIAEQVIDKIRGLAASGEVEAVFLMGTAFDEGLGETVDPKQAAAWYRRAAEAGHGLAQHNLGNAYSTGRGVEADAEQAVEWWTAAAMRGDAITQLRLGEAYENGTGVAFDTATALMWYGRAANAGNGQAREALLRLSGA